MRFRKFYHIYQYMRDVLHWLRFPQRVQDRVLWYGGACLAGRPPIYASSAALSLHVQAVVHSGPLLSVIRWSHSLCDHADSFIFCGWSKNLEWTSCRSKAPPKRFLVPIPPPSQHFFSAWPGSGAPLSMYLEGALYKF